MSKEINIPFTRIRTGRFILLLISISLTLALRPFIESFIGIGRLLMDIFVTAILISGLYVASQKKHLFYIGMLIAFPALAVHWSSYFVEVPSSFIVGHVFSAVFFTFLVVLILNYLCKEKKITADVIAGAICGYLLIGLMWASFFTVLEALQPGSFQVPDHLSTDSSYFIYYSYVTLTTLGFGDIVPMTNQARSLSIVESITGPVYLAVTVARLVGMSISQSMGKDS
ncbi:MAG: potassium channel family protein [Planctomycetota bacterium]|jgi:hypothetical protein